MILPGLLNLLFIKYLLRQLHIMRSRDISPEGMPSGYQVGYWVDFFGILEGLFWDTDGILAGYQLCT
jgi:hypothetical protein